MKNPRKILDFHHEHLLAGLHRASRLDDFTQLLLDFKDYASEVRDFCTTDERIELKEKKRFVNLAHRFFCVFSEVERNATVQEKQQHEDLWFKVLGLHSRTLFIANDENVANLGLYLCAAAVQSDRRHIAPTIDYIESVIADFPFSHNIFRSARRTWNAVLNVAPDRIEEFADCLTKAGEISINNRTMQGDILVAWRRIVEIDPLYQERAQNYLKTLKTNSFAEAATNDAIVVIKMSSHSAGGAKPADSFPIGTA